MANFVHILFSVIVICYILNYSIKQYVGTGKLVFDIKNKSPWQVININEDKMVIATTLEVKNIGKQCATITDLSLRPQLPFEYFDNVDIWGKGEVEGVPREDFYFEAIILQKQNTKDDRLNLKLILNIKARKGLSIKEATDKMVDFPVDIIYSHFSRYPITISKETIFISGEEIKNLARGKE